MDKWKEKKVAILGFGVEGKSTAKYLHKKGADITILDQKTKDQLDTASQELLDDVSASYIGGEDYLSHLYDFQVIVRSPGISALTKELIEASKKGITVTSHTQIFMDACPCQIVGVTGTKGKGTTSTLIYKMLEASGQDAYLGGNIGTPPLDFIDMLTEDSIVVLEMSSFQLEDLSKSPHIAVMLMVVPEHLNYHKDMEEYIAAKRNILSHQTPDDFAVINRDYVPSNESDIYTEGKVFYVSRERESTEQGCFVKEHAIWISMQGVEWKIINTSEIALPGTHNFENACAAVMGATLAGAAKSEIINVLKTFGGLEHRLELVKEVNGVSYYDDSFSTTPETAIAAIHAFTQPEILILGGSSKKSDFSELGKVITDAKNIKAIIGIGEEWSRIKSEIPATKSELLFVEGAKDMQTIVQAAAKIASPGDVVLLSPACASFDMFENYKERGNQFKTAVNEL